MKYKCIKTDSCSVCGNKGTIQAFLNSAYSVKYARTRHYTKGVFSYCKLENLKEVESLLNATANKQPDQKQLGQGQNSKTWSSSRLNSSRIQQNKPWASSSVRTEHQPPKLGVEGSNPSPPATFPEVYKFTVPDIS